jgi:S-DNA-T family DNA segregation ATPase FtsK/SpoIIIE
VRLTVIGRDVVVTRWRPSATIADLLHAVGEPTGPVVVDGGPVESRCLLDAAGLRQGTRIERVAPAGPAASWPEAVAAPVASVHVTGGLDAGRTVALAPGVHRIGGAVVQVGADGAVAVVGTGATVVAPAGRHDRGDDHDRVRLGGPPDAGGTWAFQRAVAPPPVVAAPIDVPVAPVGEAGGAGGTGIAVATSVASAVGVVAITGELRYALVAAIGPLALLGAAGWRRRRRRRTDRAARAGHRAAVVAFDEAVAVARAAERRRRQERAPGPVEVVRRAAGPSARLWAHPLAPGEPLDLRLGSGDVPWTPPTVGSIEGRPPGLPDAPVLADLAAGATHALLGAVEATEAAARALVCQAAVLHPPSELAIEVPGGARWRWASWLPHAAARNVPTSPGRRRLVVVDRHGPEPPTSCRTGPADTTLLLADGGPGVPAACATVLRIGPDGRAELTLAGGPAQPLLADGIGVDIADAVARRLACLRDPALADGTDLPSSARLLPLLGLDRPDAAGVAARWSAGAGRLRVPIGVGAGGEAVLLDLDADGPHALVGGTTGAGKSELLRTLVASAAATADPDELTFVLVDFKGGAAFDACASLPHVTGAVTDLDPALAERALRSLDAELRHREQVLRSAGAPDRAAYVAAGSPAGALPRLVVVVDEFAALKAELPGFVAALVAVAQRGRSLGLHLVLATQRPGGAVTDDIRSNVGIRMALRVEAASDSVDVVGAEDAAGIERTRPGRAVARLGPGPLVPFQAARCSAPPARAGSAPVEVVPADAGDADRCPGADAPAVAPHGPTELDLLVTAVRAAWAVTGRPPPRRPWLPPLPTALALERLRDAGPPSPGAPLGEHVVVGVADDPDGQRQVATAWRPADGHLLVVGALGAGTTTALATACLAATWTASPERCHLHVADLGGGDLGPLAGLPHCAGVVGASEPERLARLVRTLVAEAGRRAGSGAGPSPPAIVLAVDGYPALEAAVRDEGGDDLVDALRRLLARGPQVGIHAVLAADRPGGFPAAVAATATRRLVLPLADPAEAAALGVDGRLLRGAGAGRAVLAGAGLLVQVARAAGSLAPAVAAVAARHRPPARPPDPILVLPALVPVEDVLGPGPMPGGSRRQGAPWRLPVGLAEHDLAPASLVLTAGTGALVAGAARTGRSAALAAVIAAARATDPAVGIAVVADRRGWLAGAADRLGCCTLEPQALGGLGPLLDGRSRLLVVVDDAEGVDDPDGHLEAAAAGHRDGVVVVAAARPDGLRAAYGHWTRAVRRHRIGLLLRPVPELDGELLGARLPRRPVVAMAPGRGYLVHGDDVALVQVAATPAMPR